MLLHHREGYLVSLALHQSQRESFYSCQGPPIYRVSPVFWLGRSLYTANVVAGTCKQSRITWGCYPAFLSHMTFFGGM